MITGSPFGPFAPRHADYETKVRAIFARAAFIADLGIELIEVGAGACVTRLVSAPRLLQDGVIHAGVQITLADHTAGAAAGSLVGADETVLTTDLRVSLLRPATSVALRCRADVVRAGRTLSVAESSVFAVDEKGTERLAVVKSDGY
jgi:uncharacterized protein (TIGR00369 family)